MRQDSGSKFLDKREKFIRVAVALVACYILFEVGKSLWVPGYGIHIGLGYIGTPLHNAAAEGDLERVKRLVESGVDVNIKDRSGSTPLMSAINTMHFDVADYLLSKNANLYIKARYSGHPFDTYYQIDDPEYGPNFKIVDYLLSKGFDPHKMGYTYPVPEQESIRNKY